MRTTLNIDEALLADFREIAARSHRGLSSVIQDALREALAARAARGAHAPVDLPVFRGGGGVQPGVDLDSNAALLDLIDEADGV
ncbi:MAG: ribbon-helix-helix protein, CopG family [Actinobacteria bacterium]|nr:ribbon-helix-helix protein, CopG family [Actinomycetota bacterium]